MPMVVKILLCNLHRFADVFHVGMVSGFPSQQQDFPQAGFRNGGKLVVDFFEGQLAAVDVILTIKSAVNAVVDAVVGDVKEGCRVPRCCRTGGRSDTLPCGPFAQRKRARRRGQERCVLLFAQALAFQGLGHISGGEGVKNRTGRTGPITASKKFGQFSFFASFSKAVCLVL